MSKEFDKCHCSWPYCSWLSEQIELHAPEGHVWKGNRHRWKEVRLSKRTMFERMLFLAAMCQHVPGVEEAFQDGGRGTNRKEICLARHHFPIVVYDFLGTRRITTLVKGGQMDFLVERDGCQRLADECNRVRELVTLLKDKILMPGKLRDAFLARENEFVSSKGKLFICAPVATRDEIIDIVKTFQKNGKRSSSPKQPSPVLPSSLIVEEEKHSSPPKQPSPVLPSSSSPIAVDEEKKCPSPLPQQSSPVSPSLRIIDESSLLLLGMAAELPDAEMSPSMVPSIEECVAKIQSKVKRLGLENARHSRNFIASIRLLRFFYSDCTAIPLRTDDDERTLVGYLHPCKNDDAKHNKSCATFQITSTIVSRGLYCSPCRLEERMTNRKTNSMP